MYTYITRAITQTEAKLNNSFSQRIQRLFGNSKTNIQNFNLTWNIFLNICLQVIVKPSIVSIYAH